MSLSMYPLEAHRLNAAKPSAALRSCGQSVTRCEVISGTNKMRFLSHWCGRNTLSQSLHAELGVVKTWLTSDWRLARATREGRQLTAIACRACSHTGRSTEELPA